MKFRITGIALVLALALVACDDGTGPGNTAPLSLSIMVPQPPGGASPSLFAAAPLTLSDGVNTLVIETAEIVLREIEFERAEHLAGCDAEEGEIDGTDDDSCEEYEVGPMWLSLPLDGTVVREITVDVPLADYDEVEFDLHKVGDDPLDLAFLESYPEFDGISVKVTGTWNTIPFEYTSDVNAEQEIEFAAPLQLAGSANVTLSVDVGSWFTDSVGNLIDPNSALDGGANQSLVNNNIQNSFDGYEDDDHDGVPHDVDDDEPHS